MGRRGGVAMGTSERTGPCEARAGGADEVPQSVVEGSVMTATTQTLVTRFAASDLRGSDFAGIAARGGKVGASAPRSTDFSRADPNCDGARMGKLTYAGRKGLGADLSNVTVE